MGQVDRKASNQQRFIHQLRRSKANFRWQKRLLRYHAVIQMLSDRRSFRKEGGTMPRLLGSLQGCSLPSSPS